MQDGEQRTGAVTEILRSSQRRGAALLSAVWDWTRSILVAFVLFLVIRTFVVEAFRIPTSLHGEHPPGRGLPAGEQGGLRRRDPRDPPAPAGVREPERGDVVVFIPPTIPTKNYVKRVVGVPGDTLEMREQAPVRERRAARRALRPLHRPHAATPSIPTCSGSRTTSSPARPADTIPRATTGAPSSSPTDEYFVLGDNRDNSEDSRYWGFVSRDAIRGQPWFVYYSFDPTRSGTRALAPRRALGAHRRAPYADASGLGRCPEPTVAGGGLRDGECRLPIL